MTPLTSRTYVSTYSIEGDAFVYIDKDSGRIVTILGCPTHRLSQVG